MESEISLIIEVKIILDKMKCLEKNVVTRAAVFIEFNLSRYLIDQLHELATQLSKNEYGEYLIEIANKK